MADKTMPTPGPWRVEEGTTLIWGEYERDPVDGFLVRAGIPVAKCDTQWRSWGRNISDEEHDANAHLIAAAGTAAHECAEMGFDPIEAVRALPTLLGEYAFQHGYDAAEKFLARAAGKEEN